MPVKSKMPYNDGTYFITYTCCKWLPLIEIVQGYDIIYKGFDYLKKLGHFINGYVIMPNHVHALISFVNHGKNLNSLIGEHKRIAAYQIIKRLKAGKKIDLLVELSDAVIQSDIISGKNHHVWKNSFDWEFCDSVHAMDEVLNYMHQNPCSGKWNLTDKPEKYFHSSAKYYLTGVQGIYPVTNIIDLEDIDLKNGHRY
ncbi:MAG TPA: hypothetical protein VFV08_02635 [Puia sp.]|nr:hypothetical protein [Puia sp.]